jgi:hypothetical protein
MIRYAAIASGLILGGFAFAAQNAVAAPAAPAYQSLQAESMVEQAQYRYCRRWNRECRARHGGGWDYRRCMRRHGC